MGCMYVCLSVCVPVCDPHVVLCAVPYLNIEEPLVSSSANMPTLLYVEVSAESTEVLWSLEGEPLTGDRFRILRGGSLYISHTLLSDAGTYTVTVSNTYGVKDGTIELQVVDPTPPEREWPTRPPDQHYVL